MKYIVECIACVCMNESVVGVHKMCLCVCVRARKCVLYVCVRACGCVFVHARDTMTVFGPILILILPERAFTIKLASSPLAFTSSDRILSIRFFCAFEDKGDTEN